MRIKGETESQFTKTLGILEGAIGATYSNGVSIDLPNRTVTITIADLPKEITKIILWNNINQEAPDAAE